MNGSCMGQSRRFRDGLVMSAISPIADMEADVVFRRSGPGTEVSADRLAHPAGFAQSFYRMGVIVRPAPWRPLADKFVEKLG